MHDGTIKRRLHEKQVHGHGRCSRRAVSHLVLVVVQRSQFLKKPARSHVEDSSTAKFGRRLPFLQDSEN